MDDRQALAVARDPDAGFGAVIVDIGLIGDQLPVFVGLGHVLVVAVQDDGEKLDLDGVVGFRNQRLSVPPEVDLEGADGLAVALDHVVGGIAGRHPGAGRRGHGNEQQREKGGPAEQGQESGKRAGHHITCSVGWQGVRWWF